MSGYYAEFDLARANALLDELGMAWDGDNQYRLRPDGRPLVIEPLWVSEWLGYFEDLMDLLKGHWAKVGIHVEPKFVVEALAFQRAMANDQDLMIVETATISEVSRPAQRAGHPDAVLPSWHWITCCALSSVPWRQWHDSDGAEGEEPPQEIQEIFELAEAWLAERRGTDRYMELSKELIRRNVEGQYYIGTVTMPPTVMMLNDRVGNMQRDGGIFAALPPLTPFLPDTFYLRPAALRRGTARGRGLRACPPGNDLPHRELPVGEGRHLARRGRPAAVPATFGRRSTARRGRGRFR